MSSLTLANGRTIQLFRLYQRYSYEGSLAGLPDDERNSNLCHEAVAHARARAWLSAGAPVILIPPRIRREQAQLTPRFMRQWERMTGASVSPPLSIPYLPAVLCIGAFSSDVLKARPDELSSHLSIVWFQDTFALPLDPAVEKQIRKLAWEELAAGR
jgi:hypothetical protein